MYLIAFNVGDVCIFDWVSKLDGGVWMTCWDDKYCWFVEEHIGEVFNVCWRRYIGDNWVLTSFFICWIGVWDVDDGGVGGGGCKALNTTVVVVDDTSLWSPVVIVVVVVGGSLLITDEWW